MDDRSPRHVEGTIYRSGLLLRIAPYAWGRRYPIDPHQEGLLHPMDPRAPTVSLQDEGTVVFSIMSHDPKYRSVIDSLVLVHALDLQKAHTLVLDIRGNEGGSSSTANSLEPYYYSAIREASDSQVGPPVVLASPANLRAFQRWTQWFDPLPRWLSDLLIDLEEQTGELVSYTPSDNEEDDVPYDPGVVYDYPRHVAVLIDEGVASAGESFVLKTRPNDRVTVYGRPTQGSIDYQNVQLLPLACRARGLYLGYPTQAISVDLPQDGFNRSGIQPDVVINSDVSDPISFILENAAFTVEDEE